eukprot:GFUD01014758.1.p1 GENE.GFUD01014758.1~~GFUD01014758.1.p1  ORF type:complete len:721 (+),score=136.64 GFUD01014758.1:54-2216(+)
MEEFEKPDDRDAFEMEVVGERKRKSKVNMKLWGLKGWKAAVLRIILSVLVFCFFIYFFLLNLSLLSAGVKILFAPYAHNILNNENYEKNNKTDNPVLGFFLGELSAALLQSSSATTSIVVSMVAENGISVQAAFPVIMGANVGTTVTSTIVSMALFSERKSLRRAFMAATMHDMFNIFTSIIVLPVDWLTGGAMELMTRKMVGLKDEDIVGKEYTLSLTPTGRALVMNDTNELKEKSNDSSSVAGDVKDIDTTEQNSTRHMGTSSTSESIVQPLTTEEAEIFINKANISSQIKQKVKTILEGGSVLFYPNEAQSLNASIIQIYGLRGLDGLGARSSFDDPEDLSLRFGEIFEEDHYSELQNPISKVTRPLTAHIIQLNDYETWIESNQSVKNCTLPASECDPPHFLFENWYLMGNSDLGLGSLLLVVSTISLVLSIFLISRFFKCMLDLDDFGHKWSRYQLNLVTSKHGELYGYLLLLLGMLVSAIIQSSSAFTSMLVPLAANQIICLDCTYALTLGGNIGTTSTSLITALSQEPKDFKEALQIFLSHFFFNIIGILMFYPVKKLRIPIQIAKSLGEMVAVHKWFGLVYVLSMFLLLPLFAIGLSFAGKTVYSAVFIICVSFVLLLVLINKLQGYKNGKFLPCRFLMTWNFLPLWLHSLDPYDEVIQKISFLNKYCPGASGSEEDITRPGAKDIGRGMLSTLRRSIVRQRSRQEEEIKDA